MRERLGTQSVDGKAGDEGHRARPKEAGRPKSDCVPALPWAFREPDTRSASREALAMGLTRADPLETFLRPRLVTELRRLTSCFSAPENIFGTERPLSVVYSISPSPQLFFPPIIKFIKESASGLQCSKFCRHQVAP